MKRILRVTPLSGRRLRLLMRGGLVTVRDLRKAIQDLPGLRPLADPDCFRRVALVLGFDAVRWPGRSSRDEIDVGPEMLLPPDPARNRRSNRRRAPARRA
jgi:hypothetical protein